MADINPVVKFYKSIVEEVISDCRDIFLDDGIDEIILTELKEMWEKKIKHSNVFEFSNLKNDSNYSSSVAVASYGIISSSSRNRTCPEIQVPSIQLAGTHGDGRAGNSSTTPTATIALPYGLYQQQISALSNAGISLQPSGNGQFLAFLPPVQQRLQTTTSQNNHLGKNNNNNNTNSNNLDICSDSLTTTTTTAAQIDQKGSDNNPNVSTANNNNNQVPAQRSLVKEEKNAKKQKLISSCTYTGNVSSEKAAAVKEGRNNECLNFVVNSKTNESHPPPQPVPTSMTNSESNLATDFNSESSRLSHGRFFNDAPPPIPNNNPNRSLIKNSPPFITTNSNNTNFECITMTNDIITTENSLGKNNCTVRPISAPNADMMQSTRPTPHTIQNISHSGPINVIPNNNNNTSIDPYLLNKQYNDNNNNLLLNNPPNKFGTQAPTDDSATILGPYNSKRNNSIADPQMVDHDGMVLISNPEVSLEDFIDNISTPNCQPYSYPNPMVNNRPYTTQQQHPVPHSPIYSPPDIFSKDHSGATSNISTTTSSLCFTVNNCEHSKEQTFSSGGQEAASALSREMCELNEVDMQTIQDILELDGAADDLDVQEEDEEEESNPGSFSFLPENWNIVKLPSFQATDCKLRKIHSGEFYKNRGKIQTRFSKSRDSTLQNSMLNIERKLKATSNCLLASNKGLSSFARKNLPTQIDTLYLDTNITFNKNPEFKTNIKIKESPSLLKNNISNFLLGTLPLPGLTPLSDRHKKFQTFCARQKNNKTNCLMKSASPSDNLVFLLGDISQQLDGEATGSSSSSDDNVNDDDDAVSDDDDDDDDDDEPVVEDPKDVAIESDPLNSDDDDSDIDICAMFESDNIVVCQFEKVSRVKNKWKFHLKDGIMNLFGRDLIFSKLVGEAEW